MKDKNITCKFKVRRYFLRKTLRANELPFEVGENIILRLLHAPQWGYFSYIFSLFSLENQGQIPPRSAEIREIYGIIGILHLLAGVYNNYFVHLC